MMSSAPIPRTCMMATARAVLVCRATEFRTPIYMDIPTIDIPIITHTTPPIVCRMGRRPSHRLCLCHPSTLMGGTQQFLSKVYGTHQLMNLMVCPVGMAQRMRSAGVRILICVGKRGTTTMD
jgi:hypothetical protein